MRVKQAIDGHRSDTVGGIPIERETESGSGGA